MVRRRALIGAAVGVVLALAAAAGCAAPTAHIAAPTAAAASVPASAPAPPPRDVFADGLRPSRTGEPGLWLSWSLTDVRTGRRVGSPNAGTERTNAESSIKAWIALDHLRVADARGRTVSSSERNLIRRAVRSSDDDAAETLYRGLGRDAILTHLRSTCGVDVDTDRSAWWSFTQVTAEDSSRILGCVLRIAPGLPGGADLVTDLRSVDDEGSVDLTGLLDPSVPLAQKNGWTYHSGEGWNINCVLAWDHYTLAVMTRFPGARGEQYGWGVCRDVGGDVLDALPG